MDYWQIAQTDHAQFLQNLKSIPVVIDTLKVTLWAQGIPAPEYGVLKEENYVCQCVAAGRIPFSSAQLLFTNRKGTSTLMPSAQTLVVPTDLTMKNLEIITQGLFQSFHEINIRVGPQQPEGIQYLTGKLPEFCALHTLDIGEVDVYLMQSDTKMLTQQTTPNVEFRTVGYNHHPPGVRLHVKTLPDELRTRLEPWWQSLEERFK